MAGGWRLREKERVRQCEGLQGTLQRTDFLLNFYARTKNEALYEEGEWRCFSSASTSAFRARESRDERAEEHSACSVQPGMYP